MKPVAAKQLRDALAAAIVIRDWVASRTFDADVSDLMPRSAVERPLMIVGEALNHARRTDPSIVAEIPAVHITPDGNQTKEWHHRNPL